MVSRCGDSFHHEKGLDELLGMGAGAARQRAHMRILAQAPEADSTHGVLL